jgi:hypothetical protein
VPMRVGLLVRLLPRQPRPTAGLLSTAVQAADFASPIATFYRRTHFD